MGFFQLFSAVDDILVCFSSIGSSDVSRVETRLQRDRRGQILRSQRAWRGHSQYSLAQRLDEAPHPRFRPDYYRMNPHYQPSLLTRHPKEPGIFRR
jgi:hypothetical protein